MPHSLHKLQYTATQTYYFNYTSTYRNNNNNNKYLYYLHLKETGGMDEINLLFLIVPVVKFSEYR